MLVSFFLIIKLGYIIKKFRSIDYQFHYKNNTPSYQFTHLVFWLITIGYG
jgi:hypothetical protein